MLHAIERNERVGIFGDYDCDGVTGAALLGRSLRRHGTEPLIRLPHRIRDGYGLQQSTVDAFMEAGVSLLLTVDTGIRSVEEIRSAQEGGMDVIVIDHHRPLQEAPPACAIVHPMLGKNVPLPHPSGAGLAFLFVEALEEAIHHGTTWHDYATDLSLAMIGTIADLVELKGGNRALARDGLLALQGILEGPLAAMRDMAGCKGVLTAEDIAFRIAPRLNAAGRMDDPQIALDALLGNPDALQSLERLNLDRQSITATLWKEMESLLPEMEPYPFICLSDERYPIGIMGLLAGKITERTGKPSLVANVTGGTCVASLRSIPGYDVTEALAHNADLLSSFGGHAQAAGCSFPASVFQQFSIRLQMDAMMQIPQGERSPLLTADAYLSPMHLSLPLCESLTTLAPFGQGNREPRFILSQVLLTGGRTVGINNKHLQAFIGAHKVIAFHAGHLLSSLREPVDILCRIQRDSWKGRDSVQVVVDDIRVPEVRAS